MQVLEVEVLGGVGEGRSRLGWREELVKGMVGCGDPKGRRQGQGGGDRGCKGGHAQKNVNSKIWENGV